MTGLDGDEIAAFYDAHPYPPPVEDLDGEVEVWADGLRRRIEHTRLWPTLPYRDDHTVLVAGCGTFQAARYALRYPRASVVGIDVSPASLDATRALAEHHQLDNLELHQVPIEDCGRLDRTFDQVVCTGVLHHLADPDAGLRALGDVLAPDGALHLMVYATHGRTGVRLVQEYCRRVGVGSSPDEVADLVATLGELPTDHPISELLRSSPDFRDDAAVADALLNPRERSYTVPEALALLDRARLRFGRWFRHAPYRATCGSITETPHGARLAGLAEEEQFAAMELFRGTIRRHSLIAHRQDSPLPLVPVGFDGDAWPDYIPVRPTTTIVVEERLPPGVAGVLINQAHVHRDLVFFADPPARQVYDSIDGARRIGDIEGASVDLVQRLWWHDLVMIDASRAT